MSLVAAIVHYTVIYIKIINQIQQCFSVGVNVIPRKWRSAFERVLLLWIYYYLDFCFFFALIHDSWYICLLAVFFSMQKWWYLLKTSKITFQRWLCVPTKPFFLHTYADRHLSALARKHGTWLISRPQQLVGVIMKGKNAKSACVYAQCAAKTVSIEDLLSLIYQLQNTMKREAL